jgi:putative hydrolase of HD superfamily
MLLIHDLVEIAVGDAPIHGNHDLDAIAAAEQSAAQRIFGLLPTHVGAALLDLWQEFEAATTDDAIFAKSVDRVQPLNGNLANGGGSWVEYNVTYDQLVARVGNKVARGAPAVWDEMNDRISRHPWFANS